MSSDLVAGSGPASGPVESPDGEWDSPPELLRLLQRVGCHVYSGEVLPSGDYRETFTGPGLGDLLGITVAEGNDATETFHAAIHPDDWVAYLAAGTQMAANSTASIEYRLIQPDGGIRWVLDRMWLRRRTSDDVRIVDGVITDVTELRDRTEEANAAVRALRQVNAEVEQTRAEVSEALAWLEAAVTATPAALILVDRDLRIRLWNPAAEEMFGWKREDAIGQIAPHIPPEELPGVRILLDRLVAGETLIESEELRRSSDGTLKQVSIIFAAVREAGGEVTGFLGVVTDITNRKEMEARLRHLAHNDVLTGLANRVLFTTCIEEAFARRKSSTKHLSVLLLDLDGFKTVNDTFGHQTGDELLAAVSQRLSGCLRFGDVAARLGGDEFAVLLETTSRSEALAVAERILKMLSGPLSLGRAQVVVTASIGVVHADSYQNPQSLLRDADVAMYTAKTSGKNQVVVFRPAMQQQVARRLRLETELRRASELGQFELHYQPFQDLRTGATVALEALVRWRHPRRGLLPPAEFIAAAEETGLIVPMGQWVCEEACRQAARWLERYGEDAPTVSVNLSPRQLQDDDLVAKVGGALEAAGLPGRRLQVEITESLLMKDSDLAERRLSEIRRLGAGIALDDFGTGYSSLAYLHHYPVDALKIDQRFVGPLADGPRPAALVKSIIELARALDVTTVAEGVERPEQARILAELGCFTAQGTYLCHPLTMAELDERLDQQLAPRAVHRVG